MSILPVVFLSVSVGIVIGWVTSQLYCQWCEEDSDE